MTIRKNVENWIKFISLVSFLNVVITYQVKEMAKFEYCGDCLLKEWAVDFERDGVCSKDGFFNYTTCTGMEQHWEATVKKEAKYFTYAGFKLGYATFPQYCTTVSVLLQLVAYVSLGSLADYGSNRRKMLILNTVIGSIALLWSTSIADSSYYWVNGVLYLVASVTFSFAVVFYNAYLPLLARAQPNVMKAIQEEQSLKDIKFLVNESTHKISANGFAFGLGGQIVFLVANLQVLLHVTTENARNTRCSIFFACVWVGVFSIISFSRLKTRPGPPLPTRNVVLFGIRQTMGTLKSFYELKELGKYLIAYLVFSDGTGTLSGASLIFAQEELAMSSYQLGITLVIVSIAGVCGCFLFMKIHKAGISAKNIILINLMLVGCIPLYAMYQLTTVEEFYVAVALFGINMGSQAAFTRSLYARFIPTGREAEYFSFYVISDKGVSFLLVTI